MKPMLLVFFTQLLVEKKQTKIFSNGFFTIILIHLHQPTKLTILLIVCKLAIKSFIKIEQALFLQ